MGLLNRPDVTLVKECGPLECGVRPAKFKLSFLLVHPVGQGDSVEGSDHSEPAVLVHSEEELLGPSNGRVDAGFAPQLFPDFPQECLFVILTGFQTPTGKPKFDPTSKIGFDDSNRLRRPGDHGVHRTTCRGLHSRRQSTKRHLVHVEPRSNPG